jgi:tRNA threonylcarbamoyladenosine biosynthesis protein TsaB
MRILAVDTALGACSAAILDDNIVLARRLEIMERGHAERLAPMVREVMDEAGMGFAQIDRLAVTIGPGTFTGQRVGIAFMRGLRVAMKRPLIGITTLDAMIAAALDESGLDAAAIFHDARRGEVYCAVWCIRELVVPACLLRTEEAVALACRTLSSTPFAIGGTAGEMALHSCHALGGSPQLVQVRQPDALWVARLALYAPEPEGAPRPLYLRAPDARLPGTPAE